LPRNLAYLRRHIEMNQLGNVTVIDAAVSDITGIAYFAECGHAMGRIGQGPLKVRTVGIDDLIARGLDAPDVIKVDIEGGESVALAGMKELLRTRRPTIFLSTHGEQLNIECFATLRSFRYSISPIDGKPLA